MNKTQLWDYFKERPGKNRREIIDELEAENKIDALTAHWAHSALDDLENEAYERAHLKEIEKGRF